MRSAGCARVVVVVVDIAIVFVLFVATAGGFLAICGWIAACFLGLQSHKNNNHTRNEHVHICIHVYRERQVLHVPGWQP